jgi:hypothetical protein
MNQSFGKSRNQGFKVVRFLTFEESKFRNLLESRLQGFLVFKDSMFQGIQFSRCKVSELRDFKESGFEVYMNQGLRVSKFKGIVLKIFSNLFKL